MTTRKASLHVIGHEDAEGAHGPSDDAAAGFRHASDGSLEHRIQGGWRRVCSPLRIVARSHGVDNLGWGCVVEVTDPSGHVHRLALLARLTHGRGDVALEILLDHGLQLDHELTARRALMHYLGTSADDDGRPLPFAITTSRIGWHEAAFVLPNRTIGGGKVAIYQPRSSLRAAIRSKGTLKDWQDRVAAPCLGNSRCLFSLAAAFAPPLLGLLDYPEGFGLHWRGPSSCGKTTLLVVAGSVWGGGGLNGYRQSWHATANGIEAVAEAHSDVLLCVDELAQCRAEDAARVAYQLPSGSGKQRATIEGFGASRREWRLIYLSTGEIGLADKLREARTPQRLMAGQSVRFVDFPADAGAGYGVFDAVPGLDGQAEATGRERGRSMADDLVAAANSVYGTAGPAFLEKLIVERASAIDQCRRVIQELAPKLAPDGADGQVQRVARHLALIAAAGELSNAFGILPWPPGTAVAAVARCFADWLQGRGTTGSAEAEDVVNHLRAVIGRDGASRFQRLGTEDLSNDPVHHRLGYLKERDGDLIYLFPAESWKQVIAGRDPDRAARDLLERGILVPGEGNRVRRNERIGPSSQRVYAVSYASLFREPSEDGEDGHG